MAQASIECVDCSVSDPLSHKRQFNHWHAISGKARANLAFAENAQALADDRREMPEKLACGVRASATLSVFRAPCMYLEISGEAELGGQARIA
jgi:hypothetical protein